MANENLGIKSAIGFGGLPIVKQIGLLVGLAASIALGIVVALWSIQPNYVPVIANISPEEAGEAIDILTRNGIDYELDKKTGSILVDGNKLYNAKIQLAQAGLPRGAGTGLESLDKQTQFGSSQFMESARYRHALEGELARTISQFRNVKSARVHLAIPKTTGFLRDKRKPSASVFIDVYSGTSITSENVASISHLVASSIPGLTTNEVTVVDNQGNLLSENEDDTNFAVANRFLKYRHQVEKLYADKIQDILEPLLGAGSVKARVSADIDFTASEQTKESYDPTQTVVRSEQVIRESNSSSGAARGIPGALSNQAPAGPTAKTTEADPNAKSSDEKDKNPAPISPAASSGDSKEQSIKNFELDRTISHTQNQPGKISRITVAVVVDDKVAYDPKTQKPTYTPLTPKEIEKITQLVKDAIGFNKDRGDSVNVLNQSFSRPPEEIAVAPLQIWEQPWFWNVVKQALGGLFVILLVFVVLKPTLRKLAMNNTKSNDSEHDNANSNNPLSLQAGTSEQRIAMLRALASSDPKGIAQVVKTWVDGV